MAQCHGLGLDLAFAGNSRASCSRRGLGWLGRQLSVALSSGSCWPGSFHGSSLQFFCSIDR